VVLRRVLGELYAGVLDILNINRNSTNFAPENMQKNILTRLRNSTNGSNPC
jgi:hypothetical protein